RQYNGGVIPIDACRSHRDSKQREAAAPRNEGKNCPHAAVTAIPSSVRRHDSNESRMMCGRRSHRDSKQREAGIHVVEFDSIVIAAVTAIPSSVRRMCTISPLCARYVAAVTAI